MAKFVITTTARASIEERWEIEADSEEHARELFEDTQAERDLSLIDDRITGDEEEREIAKVEPYADHFGVLRGS